MKDKKLNLTDEINHFESENAHILIVFNQVDHYVHMAADYLSEELNKGTQVLLVENDRIYPKILKKLKKSVSDQKLLNLKRENTFDFYYEQESFNPDSIYNHFQDKVRPHVEKGERIVTWGHVEWGKDLSNKDLITYERRIDQLLKTMSVISICAYDEDRLSHKTLESLASIHDIYIRENKIVKP
ncbi:MEDS domain-containing protein [Fictibacillus sp. 26RED30]|uniref:MEDS domain-containing protein n=1 Tax=Fictibacillus sp. 26RED30 TaxID=2745877 RepID=UPI0018CD1484|nr:MEDS domain-containing protein [Fictibacillus sp. 26RED30]MBH0160408.1 MEDS domain-containing protein [Fictibacillus sp. 26RED30]